MFEGHSCEAFERVRDQVRSPKVSLLRAVRIVESRLVVMDDYETGWPVNVSALCFANHGILDCVHG